MAPARFDVLIHTGILLDDPRRVLPPSYCFGPPTSHFSAEIWSPRHQVLSYDYQRSVSTRLCLCQQPQTGLRSWSMSTNANRIVDVAFCTCRLVGDGLFILYEAGGTRKVQFKIFRAMARASSSGRDARQASSGLTFSPLLRPVDEAWQ